MIGAKPIRLGVVGGGEAATKAITALMDSPNVDLIAVACYPHELSGLVDTSGRAESYEELLGRDDIDTIYIATPNDTHVPLAIRAIQCDKNVLIEKPMGLSYKDVSRLCDYEDKRVFIAIAFKKRFGSAVGIMKDIAVAAARRLKIQFHWTIPMPLASNWRCDPRMSGGGVTVDLGSHILDLLEYLLGSIAEIEAEMEMVEGSTCVDASSHINLHFASGAVGRVNLGWRENILCQRLTFSSDMTDVTLERIGPKCDLLRGEAFGKRIERTFSPDEEYRKLVHALSRRSENGERSIPTLRDGLRNHQLIEAVYKSALERRTVCVL
ncbi:MAG: hypothetical protein DMF61_21475 [Blastocatellia bacterium AA13]|nr:MAG: hypothetical protein DMF61_21475 [Blastocatellia bacterium AA13]